MSEALGSTARKGGVSALALACKQAHHEPQFCETLSEKQNKTQNTPHTKGERAKAAGGIGRQNEASTATLA